jgi:hypothetical protein
MVEDYGILECNPVQFRDNPTFRRNNSLPHASICILFIINFDPEDGSDMSVRNFVLSPNYMALQQSPL